MDNRTYGTEVSGTSVKDSLIRGKYRTEREFIYDILGGGANAANCPILVEIWEDSGFFLRCSVITQFTIIPLRQQAFNEKLSLFLSIRGQFTDGLSSGAGQEDYLDGAKLRLGRTLWGARIPVWRGNGSSRSIDLHGISLSLGAEPCYDATLRLGKSRERSLSSGGPGDMRFRNWLGFSWARLGGKTNSFPKNRLEPQSATFRCRSGRKFKGKPFLVVGKPKFLNPRLRFIKLKPIRS